MWVPVCAAQRGPRQMAGAAHTTTADIPWHHQEEEEERVEEEGVEEVEEARVGGDKVLVAVVPVTRARDAAAEMHDQKVSLRSRYKAPTV